MARWMMAVAVALACAAPAWAEEAPAEATETETETDGEAGGGPDITFVDGDEEEAAPGDGPTAASPFASTGDPVRKDAVPGYIELSDGRIIPGRIYTTRAKRLKIFDLEKNTYEHVPVPAIKKIEADVEWERFDREWRFKEAGNPEKVYSGRTYPVRMLAWTLTLRNDHTIHGHILGQPLYVTFEGETERWILHKRQKGEIATTLGDLIYIRRVGLGKEAYHEAYKAKKEKEAREAAADSKAREPAPDGPGGDPAGPPETPRP